jgi:hypothetical protein
MESPEIPGRFNPVIDDPNVQAGFLDAIQKSGAFDGTPKNNRLEHAGYVYLNRPGFIGELRT